MQVKNMRLKKEANQVARLLKLMSNPQRLQLLCLLAERPHAVHELQTALGMAQSALSQHLSGLRTHKIVQSDVNGVLRVYKLHDPKVQALLNLLHQLYCPEGE